MHHSTYIVHLVYGFVWLLRAAAEDHWLSDLLGMSMHIAVHHVHRGGHECCPCYTSVAAGKES